MQHNNQSFETQQRIEHRALAMAGDHFVRPPGQEPRTIALSSEPQAQHLANRVMYMEDQEGSCHRVPASRVPKHSNANKSYINISKHIYIYEHVRLIILIEMIFEFEVVGCEAAPPHWMAWPCPLM